MPREQIEVKVKREDEHSLKIKIYFQIIINNINECKIVNTVKNLYVKHFWINSLFTERQTSRHLPK